MKFAVESNPRRLGRTLEALKSEGRQQLLQLPMSAAMARRREQWLSLVEEFNQRIKNIDVWLEQQARTDERVLRLQTHSGIGR